MAGVESKLAGALVAAPPPRDPEALVEYAGGKRALTQALSGLEHSPRRSEYDSEDAFKADYTKWRTASRRAQRASSEGVEGKQRRGTVKGEKLTPAQSRRLRAEATNRKIDAMARRGMRARLYVKLRRGSPGKRAEPARLREIPSGGPGLYIDPDQADDILAEIREQGGPEVAAEWFRDAVLEAYFGAGAEDVWEMEEVVWLKIWADGDPEP